MADTNTITIHLRVRRFDLYDNPTAEELQFNLIRTLDYKSLKREVRNWFQLSEEDDKVIKLRNQNLVLIPLVNLLTSNTHESYLVLDVAKIQRAAKLAVNLQDAYLDAVCQKIQNLETRAAQMESSIPQIKLRRQNHMEQTVQNMSNRVAFLDRRIDELMPPQWKSKVPVTIS